MLRSRKWSSELSRGRLLAALSVITTLTVAGLFLLTEISSTAARRPTSEAQLNAIYSKILCIKCGCKVTIDVCQWNTCRLAPQDICPKAEEARTLVKERLEEGATPDEVIWNFNAGNVAFMFRLPQQVIREGRCPCACGETIEVCIGELRPLRGIPGCPVIREIMGDIRKLSREGDSDGEILDRLEGREFRERYEQTISARVEALRSESAYAEILEAASFLPEAILDDVECTCACTESLRTCIERMPWCERIRSIISDSFFLMGMGLTPEETAASIVAPCGKTCAKEVSGKYLGINGERCGRPIRDRAYYAVINGERKTFCCESCYKMGVKLPDEILDNVKCQVCDSGLTLRNAECRHIPRQKMLIRIWLMQGKTPEEIIRRFSDGRWPQSGTPLSPPDGEHEAHH